MTTGDRSLSSVLQDIVRNVQDIVRAEVRLAKTEVRDELAAARVGTLMVAIGAVSGLFSAMFVLLAAVYALELVMPAWAAALTVGVVIAIVAGLVLSTGLKRFKKVQGAPRTVAQLKETIEWAKPHSK